MNFAPILKYSELRDRVPAHAQLEDIDLVVIRYADRVSVFYGRCLHLVHCCLMALSMVKT